MSYQRGDRKKVVQEGPSTFQGRYYDKEMRLWFDLGDPRPTREEAQHLIDHWDDREAQDLDEYLRPEGEPLDPEANPFRDAYPADEETP